MSRRIEVVEFDPKWAEKFAEESKKLKKLLGRNCVAVYHIGSTAVEGMRAKPTVDILIAVKDLAKVDAVQSKFQDVGYEAFGENGIPGRRFFAKGGDTRTFHVHIFHEKDEENIWRHLAVVEYLKRNEKRREEYSELKTYLAEACPEDPEGYVEGKAYFVAQLEQEALNNVSREKEDQEDQPRSVPISLAMEFGLVLGLTVFDNIGVGLCVGLCLAFAISKLKEK